MTVVEGWFSDRLVKSDSIKDSSQISQEALGVISQNIAINRSCDVHFKDEDVSVFCEFFVLFCFCPSRLLSSQWLFLLLSRYL